MIKCLVIVVIIVSGCLCRVTPDDVTTRSETRERTTDIGRTSDNKTRTPNPESTQALSEERRADELEKRSANNDTTQTIAETKSVDSKKELNGATTIEAKTGTVDRISTINNSDIRAGSIENNEDGELLRSDDNDASRTQQSDKPDDPQSRSGILKTDIATTDNASHINIKEGKRAPREETEVEADGPSQLRKNEENNLSNDELRTSSDAKSKSADNATESRKSSPEEENIHANQDDLRTDKLFDESTEDLLTTRINPSANEDKPDDFDANEVRMAPREEEDSKDLLTRRMNTHGNEYKQDDLDAGKVRMAPREDESRKSEAPVAYRRTLGPSQHLKSDYTFSALVDIPPSLPRSAKVSSTEYRLDAANLEPHRASYTAQNSQEKEFFNRRSSFNLGRNSVEKSANLQFPFPALDSETPFKPAFQKPEPLLKIFLDEPQAPFKPFLQEFNVPPLQKSSAEIRSFLEAPQPLLKPLLQPQATFRASLPDRNGPFGLSYSEESRELFKPLYFQPHQQFKQFFQDFKEPLQDTPAPLKVPSLSMLDRLLKLPPLPLNQRPFLNQESWDSKCAVCNNPSRQNWQWQPQQQRLKRSLLPTSMPDLALLRS